MKQVEKAGPLFTAVLLLAFFISMPVLFTGFEEKSLINRVVTEELPENVSMEYSKTSLSVAEKLEMIASVRSGSRRISWVQGGISMAASDEEIRNQACAELEKLIKMQAIIEFPAEDCELIGGDFFTFVDTQDMSRSVYLMWLHMDADIMMVDALMDMETGQIYEYNLYYYDYDMIGDSGEVFEEAGEETDGSLDLVGLDEMIRNFQQYLGLSWEEFESYYDILNMPRYIGLK